VVETGQVTLMAMALVQAMEVARVKVKVWEMVEVAMEGLREGLTAALLKVWVLMLVLLLVLVMPWMVWRQPVSLQALQAFLMLWVGL
jgi:hypothetical protein